MTSASTQDLAGALRRRAVQAVLDEPSAVGADWRQAVVDTVQATTVTTTDGIIARRMDTYVSAAVGDLIAVTLASSGSWLAWGRLSDGGVAVGETVAARKPASTSRASTTALAADPHLSVTVSPGTYSIDAFLMYDGDAAADLKLGWSPPAGTTGAWWPGGADSSVAAQASLPRWGALSDIGTSTLPVGAIGTGAIVTCRPVGTAVVTTGGTFALVWAQQVTSATATILRGQSTLRLQRIA
ncbi:hypothetical protein PV405_08715 [Streptomyces sp. ME02-6979-3A]|uniref:hypothetical protein n=1 Tax=Streptomyces sp. ME02-6979-3A TaxID=3028673 RepID=UPI0029BE1BC1|nr:hypothetical protein [Streptomyces sp. ME02-6979-3A]MDX3324748.1 hypothetical protein [Streptomyces sp. ME02-6979-3A]